MPRMAVRALPDGYADAARGPVRLVARRDVMDALVAAGALDGAPPERWGERLDDVGGGRRAHLALRVPGVEPVVLVKRVVRGGLLGPLLGGRATPDRAFTEILVTETLRGRGVSTPPVLAARMTRRGSAESPVAIELVLPRIDGAKDLAAWLRAGPPPRERTRVLGAAGAAIAALHAAGVLHADLNARNLLVDGPRVLLIDLGGGRARRATGAGRARNLARLWRSAVKLRLFPEAARATDAVRLLRGYAADDGGWQSWFRAARRSFARTLPFHRVAWLLNGR
jgi:3-deoxy-D-manno-octulosonic acid kinase